ncbi:MAG: hypothetical protein ABJA78_10715 [Ferruginibacter sp.]
MKHVNLKGRLIQLFPALCLAALCLFAFSSCGTIFSAFQKGKRPAYLVDCPKDVVVKLDGKELPINLEVFASKEFIGSTASVNYYTSAIKLPYKKPIKLEFYSAAMGKTATLEMKPGRYKGIFFLNLITFPIVGHIVDAVTHNNKIQKPGYIDVMNVLNNVPMKDWPSQKKLKQMEKKKAKKNPVRS